MKKQESPDFSRGECQASKSEQEHKHILRTPSAFGKRTKSFDEASGFVTVQGGYWGKVADGATKILRAKYASGELKKPTVSRGKVSKVSILIIILVVSFASAIVYAQFQGQFTATTTVRSPIVVHISQIIIPSIWVNASGSYIANEVFTINPNGVQTTYFFHVFATVTCANGTQTQDMSQLFKQLTVTFNSGTANVTTASLLLPNQTVSFIASNNVDEVYRLIFTYDMKAVDLGSTSSTSLVFSFLYSWS